MALRFFKDPDCLHLARCPKNFFQSGALNFFLKIVLLKVCRKMPKVCFRSILEGGQQFRPLPILRQKEQSFRWPSTDTSHQPLTRGVHRSFARKLSPSNAILLFFCPCSVGKGSARMRARAPPPTRSRKSRCGSACGCRPR